ncbi:MAG: hypothetical protein ACTSRB_14085 [Candidatus Helarchaeota archaeon]
MKMNLKKYVLVFIFLAMICLPMITVQCLSMLAVAIPKTTNESIGIADGTPDIVQKSDVFSLTDDWSFSLDTGVIDTGVIDPLNIFQNISIQAGVSIGYEIDLPFRVDISYNKSDFVPGNELEVGMQISALTSSLSLDADAHLYTNIGTGAMDDNYCDGSKHYGKTFSFDTPLGLDQSIPLSKFKVGVSETWDAIIAKIRGEVGIWLKPYLIVDAMLEAEVWSHGSVNGSGHVGDFTWSSNGQEHLFNVTVSDDMIQGDIIYFDLKNVNYTISLKGARLAVGYYYNLQEWDIIFGWNDLIKGSGWFYNTTPFTPNYVSDSADPGDPPNDNYIFDLVTGIDTLTTLPGVSMSMHSDSTVLTIGTDPYLNVTVNEQTGLFLPVQINTYSMAGDLIFQIFLNTTCIMSGVLSDFGISGLSIRSGASNSSINAPLEGVSPGEYNVTIIVMDELGNSNSANDTVNITSTYPSVPLIPGFELSFVLFALVCIIVVPLLWKRRQKMPQL